MRLFLPLLLFAVLVLAAYAPSPERPAERPLAPADSEWAWPDHPENLQVLPEDVGAEGLRAVMRGFTRALGVRCHYCHVGQQGQDFLEWDFASDAKDTKEIARAMMRMTAQLNRETLPAIDGLHALEHGPPESPAQWIVTCWTCHRGEAHPETVPPPQEDPPASEEDQPHDEGHEHDDHPHDHDHDHGG